ncbi:hypothetical protein J3R83DRAFT_10686 [Lanmaoa asiatica]|nr:hypothetical protein J3R83DRAFT_10686 [Lanmaoa asiatica]
MWKKSLVAGFHSRSASLKAQGAPLIPSKGARPFSTATLDPVQEKEGNDEEPCDVPSGSSDAPTTTNSQVVMPVTATAASDEKATPPSVPVAHKNDPAPSKDCRDIESHDSSKMRSIRSFLMEEIDTAQAAAPLSAYCFMTGFIDAVSFSAIFVWCAFQTGNSVQLALALARLFNGQHDYSFHIADQQALCSVLCFIFGAFIGRIGDKIGCKTRMWIATQAA